MELKTGVTTEISIFSAKPAGKKPGVGKKEKDREHGKTSGKG